MPTIDLPFSYQAYGTMGRAKPRTFRVYSSLRHDIPEVGLGASEATVRLKDPTGTWDLPVIDGNLHVPLRLAGDGQAKVASVVDLSALVENVVRTRLLERSFVSNLDPIFDHEDFAPVESQAQFYADRRAGEIRELAPSSHDAKLAEVTRRAQSLVSIDGKIHSRLWEPAIAPTEDGSWSWCFTDPLRYNEYPQSHGLMLSGALRRGFDPSDRNPKSIEIDGDIDAIAWRLDDEREIVAAACSWLGGTLTRCDSADVPVFRKEANALGRSLSSLGEDPRDMERARSLIEEAADFLRQNGISPRTTSSVDLAAWASRLLSLRAAIVATPDEADLEAMNSMRL